MTDDLVEFLRARLDEEADLARATDGLPRGREWIGKRSRRASGAHSLSWGRP
jgi:hypothetical protein